MGINSIDAEDNQFAYRYDTQLLIDRRDEDLDEDAITDYITEHFEGNSLIAAGDEDLVKIHFHTNEPWKILEYCNSIGEIYDIVVEDMIRQADGLQGQMQIIDMGIALCHFIQKHPHLSSDMEYVASYGWVDKFTADQYARQKWLG